MKNAIRVFLILFLMPSMTCSAIYAAENKITLGTQKPKDSPSGKFLNLVYTEAFKRLGIIFVYKTFPAKRLSLMSDQGKLDGELSRIASYNEFHPNVIRVEEPHWTSGFIAVARTPSIYLSGWESLKKTNYRVNYRRGIKGCELNLPKVVIPENLDDVGNEIQGFRKVLMGRTDIFIGAEMDLVSTLASDEFKDSDLRIVGVMERFTGHVFLHKKHKKLVLKLSGVLKEMKREGLFEKYSNSAKLIRATALGFSS